MAATASAVRCRCCSGVAAVTTPKKPPMRPAHRWMRLPVEAYTATIEIEFTEEERAIVDARAAAAGMDIEEYLYACFISEGNA